MCTVLDWNISKQARDSVDNKKQADNAIVKDGDDNFLAKAAIWILSDLKINAKFKAHFVRLKSNDIPFLITFLYSI